MALSAANASELIQETVSTILVQPLTEASQFLAAGPRIIETAGPVRVPKLTGTFSTAFYGQNEQIQDTDPEFDEVSLLPSTMKSIKTLTKFSNELARQSVVSLETALREALVRDVANAMDAQLFSASGDGVTTPQGLFAYAGTQKIAVGGELTLDHLLDAQGLAMGANVDLARTKWVVTPGDFIRMRKLKDNQDRYQLQPDPTQAGTFRLFGIPVIVTNRVPDTTGATPTGRAALVDFSQITVARDVAPSVTILSETYGDFDQQAIRVVYRVDAKPVNPEAIVTLTGITR